MLLKDWKKMDERARADFILPISGMLAVRIGKNLTEDGRYEVAIICKEDWKARFEEGVDLVDYEYVSPKELPRTEKKLLEFADEILRCLALGHNYMRSVFYYVDEA
jgi:hypothetical protein